MSAGLYIHIPFCDAKCSYCDFVSFPRREGDILRYMDALAAEAQLRKPLPQFTSVFFGGGTPSVTPPEAIPRLLDQMRSYIATDAEITCEANPGSLSERHVRAWKESGVNRLSLGAQAAQTALLRRIGRRHTWSDVQSAAALWGQSETLSLDLMHTLPGQSERDWEETIGAALALSPGHISCYALTPEPGTPLYSKLEKGELTLPGDEEFDAQNAATRLLEKAGLRRYEVSNYALPGRECRHNLLYWLRGEYIGLGCAAHSFQRGGRSANPDDLDQYISSIESGRLPTISHQALTQQEAWFEELMLGLRLTKGISLSPGAYAHYKTRLLTAEEQGLITLCGGRAAATQRGMDVLNSLLTYLDGE